MTARWFTLVVAVYCCSNVMREGNCQLDAATKTAYLDAINGFRRLTAYGLTGAGYGNKLQPPAADLTYLLWDDDLADPAQSDSTSCVAGHTSVSAPKFGTCIGQNMDLNPTNDVARIINTYYSEWAFYTKLNNRSYNGTVDIPKYNSPDPYPVGHYTQLMWNNTKYVGCGHTFCQNYSGLGYNYTLSFCNFANCGNIAGSLPYTVGPACTRCKPDAPWCMDGLCTTQAVCTSLSRPCTCNVTCANSGILNPTTCTCSCPTTPINYVSFFCDMPCFNLKGNTVCKLSAKPTYCVPAYWNQCQLLCGKCNYRNMTVIPQANRDNITSNNFDITMSAPMYYY